MLVLAMAYTDLVGIVVCDPYGLLAQSELQGDFSFVKDLQCACAGPEASVGASNPRGGSGQYEMQITRGQDGWIRLGFDGLSLMPF
jgi:hypothetical protein